MKSLCKISAALSVIALLSSGCTHHETTCSLLQKPGQEKRFSKYCGENDFSPYSKVMKKSGKRYVVTNPDKKPRLAIGFSGVALNPETIYEFCIRYVGSEGVMMDLAGTEFSGQTERWSRPLVRTMSFLNVNGVTEYRKEFAVSPGTTNMIPTLFLHGQHGLPKHNILLLEDVSIIAKGKMKHASPEIKKINLAGEYDFSKYPEGNFRKIIKGRGKPPAHWSDVTAEVVKNKDFSALHIVRKPENYIYPYINLIPFPVDPQYHFIRVSITAKGKGSFRTGLWWIRNTLGFDYENTPECILSDEWQTFTMVRPCMTPDVKAASLSFTSRGDGEFWIKEISVTVE